MNGDDDAFDEGEDDDKLSYLVHSIPSNLLSFPEVYFFSIHKTLVMHCRGGEDMKWW